MRDALAEAINAFLGGKDYSNGAIGWDGNDMDPKAYNKQGGYRERYVARYLFTDPAHAEMFDLKSLKVSGSIKSTEVEKDKKPIFYNYDYKYQSTAAYQGLVGGKPKRTIFYRPSDAYIKATQHSYSRSNGTYKYKPYGGAASKN